MFGLSSKLRAKRRAWRLAVGAAAGISIRDHGEDAEAIADGLAREAADRADDEGRRFWTAVAAEIGARGAGPGKPDPSFH